MATAETARLIASLEMKDAGFSRTADAAIGKVDRLEGRLSRIGNIAGNGLRTAARNLTRIGIGLGAAAAVGIAAGIKNGIDELITLENATSQVDEAIRQVGLSGRISARQIAQWADEIETAVDAAFDDKDILAASENLIRFGNIAPSALRETLVVATDLAAAMGGDVNAASLKMAKALANPLKATRLLTQAGVHLDEAEQKRIDRLVKSGKIHKAQALLIDLVREKTDGAAKGLNGPTADALNRWNEALEKVSMALASSFLPLMTEVADFLTRELAKPGTIDTIKGIGSTLADVARSGFEFAKKIPWAAIGDGLKMAADWAGKLFAAFQSMPPEVQATIIALAGLNKLSGGAIGSIVSELGKGLIKGVLGMTAGVVHLKAATVVGGGGVPGPGGGVTPVGGGKDGGIGGALGTLGAITILAAGADLFINGIPALVNGLRPGNADGDEGRPARGALGAGNNVTTPMLERQLGAMLGNIGRFGADRTKNRAMADPDARDGQRQTNATLTSIKDLQQAHKEALRQGNDKQAAKIERQIGVLQQGLRVAGKSAATERDSLIAFRAGERAAQTGFTNTTRAAQVAGVVGAMATGAGAGRVVQAINTKDMTPDVLVTTTVNVTANSVQRSVTTQTSYGRGTGSSGGGRNGGGVRERQPV